MTDDLLRLRRLAMLIEVSANPAVKRRATHLYLETLCTLACKAFPSLRPFGSKIGLMTLKPLSEVQEALLQASNGEVPKLFGDVFKTRRPGRPPTSRREQLCWASASAVIPILMQECDKTEEEAARLVERHLRLRGFRLPSVTRPDVSPAWRRLQSYRDKCSAGMKGELASRYYRDALWVMGDSCNTTSEQKLTPQEWMDFLLTPPFSAYEPSP